MNTLAFQEILKYLPHRYPFLLIDQVLDFEAHKSLIAIKNVTFNEPYFVGHFPGNPIMPGVLILEALAQACCILAAKSTEKNNPNKYLYLFAGANEVRFKRVVRPSDQLRLKVEVKKARQRIWKFSGIASVETDLACEAEITSAIKLD